MSLEKGKITWHKQFMAKYTIEDSDKDTIGVGTISNSGALELFAGATVPALADATYDLDVDADGGGNNALAIPLLAADDWDGIAAKIQTALQAATSGSELVTITDGKITITSGTVGSSSTIVIVAGTTGSGGGDLIAAITALSADYIATIDSPVDGSEGKILIPLVKSAGNIQTPTKEAIWTYSVRNAAGQELSGFKSSYDVNTGYITIEDDSSSLATTDVVTLGGSFL